jgi:hypothetical protein
VQSCVLQLESDVRRRVELSDLWVIRMSLGYETIVAGHLLRIDERFLPTSVTPKKGPLRLIVLYTCISLRGMIFMGFPSYFGTKTAPGTTIGKYIMGQT